MTTSNKMRAGKDMRSKKNITMNRKMIVGNHFKAAERSRSRKDPKT
jgi:hypothetical protein